MQLEDESLERYDYTGEGQLTNYQGFYIITDLVQEVIEPENFWNFVNIFVFAILFIFLSMLILLICMQCISLYII